MLSDLWIRTRSLFRRKAVESELADELGFHLEAQINKYMRSGLTREEAQRRARLEFGGVEQVKEECREARGIEFIEMLFHDLRYALRILRKSPGFSAIVILTLALGVAANTVVFSVVEGILLKPLPYPHAERLVVVAESAFSNGQPLAAGPSNYFVYRDQGRTFDDMGMMNGDSVSITGAGDPEQVQAERVTDGLLSVLGVAPALGRGFNRQDDLPGSPETAILMYGYWQHKFGGDRGIIGRILQVDGKPRQVIGVMPRDFHLPNMSEPALLLPFQRDRQKTFLGNFSYTLIARLKPGVSMEQASADVARMLPIVLRSFPAPPGFSLKMFEEANLRPFLKPLKAEVVGDVGSVLWVLMGSIGVVLLIACANVANLLLVRMEGRRQELAVRAALGARRSRIAAELLSESLILGFLASLAGLALASGALRLLVAFMPTNLPRMHEVGVDGAVLFFTLGLAVLTSLLFGSIPILKYAGPRLSTGLREGARGLSHSREQHRARSVLVVAQVALALVLLISSGLMARTFVALTKVEPGFSDPKQIQTFVLYIPKSRVPDDEQVTRTWEEILRKVAAVPGISSAALSTSLPMDGGANFDPVFAEDHAYKAGELAPIRRFKYISPGFLSTMGTPLVAGRDFIWTDVDNKTPVALVSENTARELWQSPANAVGKRVRVGQGDDWREVVGVVADVYDDGVNQDASKSAYWPLAVRNFEGEKLRVQRGMGFALRTPRAGSESLMNDVRQAVWSVDPNLPFSDVHSEEFYYRSSMVRTAFTLLMLGVAGSMALLLGTIGIYGVIAYSVSQRTREIGIRMALGAQRQELTGLFVRHGLTLATIGVLAGLIVAAFSTRMMTAILYKVSPLDWLTYSAVALGLLATAFLASYLPSRRAAGVNPVEALRAE
jgi:predicted permease